MARVIVIRQNPYESQRYRNEKPKVMIYKTSDGYRHMQPIMAMSRAPRHSFQHYTPNVGPVFRDLYVEAGKFAQDFDSDITSEMHGPRVTSPLKDVRAGFGDTVTLKAEITGNPRPKITWYRDNRVVEAGYKFWIHYDGKNAELTIYNATQCEAGWYKCVAENSLGTRESACRLLVAESLKPSHNSPAVYKTLYQYRWYREAQQQRMLMRNNVYLFSK